MSSIYKVTVSTEKYNTTLAEYEVAQEDELSVIAEETFEGNGVALVAGIGKVIANLNGTYFIHVVSSDSTAVMEITVGAQTINFKNFVTTVLTGNSVFIDADKNCSVTYKAYKLS